jgi:hypothetical protein
MADTKISALTASTTPLAGTEVLPIVQSGVTKQVSVANLTAGRAISATQLTLTTGNLIVASGQGIDFSATPGTGTSELLADYEEGTWSPVVSSTIGTITSYTATGVYTKIGRVVNIQVDIQITNVGSGGGGLNFSLPFTQSGTVYAIGVGREDATSGFIMQISTTASDGTFYNSTNAGGVGAGYRQRGSLTYITS